jgi:hypothetical protein
VKGGNLSGYSVWPPTVKYIFFRQETVTGWDFTLINYCTVSHVFFNGTCPSFCFFLFYVFIHYTLTSDGAVLLECRQ